MIGGEDVSAFRSDGFVVLRNAFDSELLAREVDDALADLVAPAATAAAATAKRVIR